MKKTLYNSNLYILLLLPVFLIISLGVSYQAYQVALPNVQTEIAGIFNNRTIFQVLCEVVVNQIR
ncbi:MAG: hypothetical protein EOP42_11195 [Sphingobacteriaceae bacterium]|nr:MAG: hypothetical protein EOP42_11195 [Sphingobacteriaceae bacterium]